MSLELLVDPRPFRNGRRKASLSDREISFRLVWLPRLAEHRDVRSAGVNVGLLIGTSPNPGRLDIDAIAQLIGCTSRTVRSGLKQLVDAGLISITRLDGGTRWVALEPEGDRLEQDSEIVERR